MTEEQLFVAMLDRAKIPYEKATKSQEEYHNMKHPDTCVAYTLQNHEDPALYIGYSGFCGEFQFNKDGLLITAGFWE